jgi:HTH-type transcriptional regulator / antitoxin HigA
LLHRVTPSANRYDMTAESSEEFDELTRAWQEFEGRVPVRLCAIQNDLHLCALVEFMNALVDRIGDQENHPLMQLLEIATVFVHDDEEWNIGIPDASPSAVLRFLMSQHGMRQADLRALFGSRSNVSEVLNGKREINSRQAQSLAKRFGLSPACVSLFTCNGIDRKVPNCHKFPY